MHRLKSPYLNLGILCEVVLSSEKASMLKEFIRFHQINS